MTKDEYNLEAYRILCDNLHRIRTVLRRALHTLHGDHWEAVAEPGDRRTFLAQRREREQSINWRRTTSDDLLQYGNFSDLYEFVASDRRLFELFATVAKDLEVLRLRFLEVDAIFNRVAYARPISDSEMELLVNFDERLRRLADGHDVKVDVAEMPLGTASQPQPPTSPPPQPTPTEATAQGPSPFPERRSPKSADPAAEKAKGEGISTQPTTAPAGSPVAPITVSPSRLREALQNKDHATILAGLYSEVTSIADGLWSDSSCPSPRMWETVRESAWYSENFTTLGLKALSDFYDLAEAARLRLLEGMSRKQLQDFLKERNFAQMLLALRDLFRARLSQPPPN